MTRSQRRWHVYVWIVLGPLIALGLVAALSARVPPAIQPEIRPAAGAIDYSSTEGSRVVEGKP